MASAIVPRPVYTKENPASFPGPRVLLAEAQAVVDADDDLDQVRSQLGSEGNNLDEPLRFLCNLGILVVRGALQLRLGGLAQLLEPDRCVPPLIDIARPKLVHELRRGLLLHQKGGNQESDHTLSLPQPQLESLVPRLVGRLLRGRRLRTRPGGLRRREEAELDRRRSVGARTEADLAELALEPLKLLPVRLRESHVQKDDAGA